MYRNRVKNDREYLHHFHFTNEKIQKRKIQNNFPVSFYTHFSHLQDKRTRIKKSMLFLNIPIYIHAVAEHVSIFDRHTKNVLKMKRLQKLMDYKKI